MSLSLAQKQAIKAYIDATPVLAAQPMNPDGAFVIAEALNAVATPAFIVWRTSLTRDEITQNGFTWTEVDSLAVGKARIWDWMFENTERAFNPSKPNVRAGIIEVWSGTAGRLTVQAGVLNHCKRSATVAEKLLATGTGSDASPATMSFEGALSYNDVQEARAV